MSENEFKLYDTLEKDHWWFKARRNILAVFLNIIEKTGEKTILEIGCGTGGNLIYLFQNFKKRIGLEINETAIKYARRKKIGNTNIIKGNANNLDMTLKPVDCVALLDVLYHENIESVDSSLIQVNKLLKKDGYLLISDGAFDILQGSHSDTVNSVRRFTKKGLIEKLSNANFKIVRASYWGFSLFFLLFFKRFIIERFFQKNSSKQSTDLVSIPIIDDLLYLSLELEKLVLKSFNLPFGASVFILAQKIK